MVSIAYLDINLWINGWIQQPNLVVIYKPAPSSDKTVSYKLVDMNGTVVTDTGSATLSAGSEKININLGDFINAQKKSKNFNPGLYFVYVEIKEDSQVFALPIFISDVAVSEPPTGRQDLDHIMIIDKVTGYMMKLPPTITAIPADDRYMVYAYYHKEGKGRIVQFNASGTVFDTGYHRFVKMKIKLRFSSFNDMLYHMLIRSWNIPEQVAEKIIDEINSGSYDQALKLLRPYYSFTWIGRTLSIDFDTSSYEIIITNYIYLGQLDWYRVFGWGAIGCGLAVAGAVAFTVVTAGAGSITLPLVAGACVAGGAVGAGIAVLSSSSSPGEEQVIADIEKTGQEGKEKNKIYHDEAKQVLDEWLSEGKITQKDYSKMIEILDSWYAKMNASIDEIVSLSKDAYRTGYIEGEENMKKWAIISGVGGFALGLVVKR